MIDLHLRADTEADMISSLPWAYVDGAWATSTAAYALDLIGPLSVTPPVIDEHGNVVTPADIDRRFHANIRLLDDSLRALIPDTVVVEALNPRRVWA